MVADDILLNRIDLLSGGNAPASTAGGPAIDTPALTGTPSEPTPYAFPDIRNLAPTLHQQEALKRFVIQDVLPTVASVGTTVGLSLLAPETLPANAIRQAVTRGIGPVIGGGVVGGLTRAAVTAGDPNRNPLVEGAVFGGADIVGGATLGRAALLGKGKIPQGFGTKFPLFTQEERNLGQKAVQQGIELTPQQLSERNIPEAALISEDAAKQIINKQQQQSFNAEQNLTGQLGVPPVSREITEQVPTINQTVNRDVAQFQQGQQLPTTQQTKEVAGEAFGRIHGAQQQASEFAFNLRDEAVGDFGANARNLSKSITKISEESKGLKGVDEFIQRQKTAFGIDEVDELSITDVRRFKRNAFNEAEIKERAGDFESAKQLRKLGDKMLKAEDSIVAKASGEIKETTFGNKNIQRALNQLGQEGGGRSGLTLKDTKKIIQNQLQTGRITEDTATRAYARAEQIHESRFIQDTRKNLPDLKTIHTKTKAFYGKTFGREERAFVKRLEDVIDKRPQDLASEFANPEDMKKYIQFTGSKGKKALADRFIADVIDDSEGVSRAVFSEGSETFTPTKSMRILNENPAFAKELLGEARFKEVNSFLTGVTNKKIRAAVFTNGGVISRTNGELVVNPDVISKNVQQIGQSNAFSKQELQQIQDFVDVVNKTRTTPIEKFTQGKVQSALERMVVQQTVGRSLNTLSAQSMLNVLINPVKNLLDPKIDVTALPLSQTLGLSGTKYDLLRGAQNLGQTGAGLLPGLFQQGQNQDFNQQSRTLMSR